MKIPNNLSNKYVNKLKMFCKKYVNGVSKFTSNQKSKI